MKKIKISQQVTFSQFSQGFWRMREWGFTENELINFLHKISELGITTFDHADIYGNYQNEEIFGKAFKNSGLSRSNFQFVTKCGIKLVSENRPENTFHSYDTSKKHIIHSAENSLKFLKTDYLDVLLIHRPDFLMNADEVAEAFTELKLSGKVVNFGVSNFNQAQFSLLQSRIDFPLITNQIELSLLNLEHLENGNLYYLQEKKVKPMIWSPLAGGKIFTIKNEQNMRIHKEIEEIARKSNFDNWEAIAISWILKFPLEMNIILGSGKIERIKSQIESINFEMERDDWFKLWTAIKGFQIP